MKVASFNVNSIRSRLPIVLDWLARHQPDVLAVQETKVQDGDFPNDDFRQMGYQAAFRGEKAYNGVAIFSSTRISDVRLGFADEPVDQARLIAVRIKGIHIVNTYVPQGDMPDSDKFAYKLRWFDRLLRFFASNFSPRDPVVWLGDLNIAPLAIDVYDPKTLLGHVCYHPAVHAALGKVMAWGFVDVFRLHCGEPGQYTFWDFRLRNAVSRNLGWRIDHIMATEPLAAKCTACYIDKQPRLADRPSDHTPIVAEFGR